jgi:hypothetical protein
MKNLRMKQIDCGHWNLMDGDRIILSISEISDDQLTNLFISAPIAPIFKSDFQEDTWECVVLHEKV